MRPTLGISPPHRSGRTVATRSGAAAWRQHVRPAVAMARVRAARLRASRTRGNRARPPTAPPRRTLLAHSNPPTRAAGALVAGVRRARVRRRAARARDARGRDSIASDRTTLARVASGGRRIASLRSEASPPSSQRCDATRERASRWRGASRQPPSLSRPRSKPPSSDHGGATTRRLEPNRASCSSRRSSRRPASRARCSARRTSWRASRRASDTCCFLTRPPSGRCHVDRDQPVKKEKNGAISLQAARSTSPSRGTSPRSCCSSRSKVCERTGPTKNASLSSENDEIDFRCSSPSRWQFGAAGLKQKRVGRLGYGA